jgi:hypothetical protein
MIGERRRGLNCVHVNIHRTVHLKRGTKILDAMVEYNEAGGEGFDFN